MAKFASFPFSLVAFVAIGAISQRYSCEVLARDGGPLEITAYTSPITFAAAIEIARDMVGGRGYAVRVVDERGAIVWSRPRNPALDAWESPHGWNHGS